METRDELKSVLSWQHDVRAGLTLTGVVVGVGAKGRGPQNDDGQAVRGINKLGRCVNRVQPPILTSNWQHAAPGATAGVFCIDEDPAEARLAAFVWVSQKKVVRGRLKGDFRKNNAADKCCMLHLRSGPFLARVVHRHTRKQPVRLDSGLKRHASQTDGVQEANSMTW